MFEAQIVGLSFAVEPQKAYYVALPDDKQKTEEILRRFAPLLEDASIEKTGQNMKYDISVLGNYGIGVDAIEVYAPKEKIPAKPLSWIKLGLSFFDIRL